MAFITWAHHGLIQGNRKAAVYGTIITIIFAILFTGLQYLEYKEAGFTFADSVFGSAFFASTGLHGLILLAPTKINKFNFVNLRKIHIRKMDMSFLEWFTGFVDAEGNFNISLRNYNIKDNKYNSLILTFQIGLHIDDLNVLNLIKDKLGCGKISISKDRCNFFVNDQISLINIICPLFNLVKLKSSKYYQFLIFEKAIKLVKTKSHLTNSGKNEIILYYHQIKSPLIYLEEKAPLIYLEEKSLINKYWLGGFVDGDASFSARLNRPVFKFENDIKEMALFKDIIAYFNYGKINIAKVRNKDSQMIILEFNNIQFLKNVIVPLFSETRLLKSKKSLDFKDFCILVYIYYYGYHNLPKGNALATDITSKWNNFRLSNNKSYLSSNVDSDTLKNKTNTIDDFNNSIDYKENLDIKKKYEILSKIPSPYEIKDGGFRYYRNTSKLVSDKIKIIAIDLLNNKFHFSSISECSKVLQIKRNYIKESLLKGTLYRNYHFRLDNFTS